MRSAAAEKQAAEFGVPAMRVDQMLKRDDIEIVVNLTVPLAHTDVSLRRSQRRQACPFGEAARREHRRGAQGHGPRRGKGLRVGCAPDTFLGGGHQTARKLIDDGAIGRRSRGSAFFMCPGHERWHPAPGFYYLRGGGPMLDMGPYYITDLIQSARARSPASWARPPSRELERLVTSQPMNGTLIPVEVATHVAGSAGIRERRGRVDRHELRRAEAQSCADRDLRHGGQHPRARSQPVRRRGRAWPSPAANGRPCPIRMATPTASSARSASPTWRPRSRSGRPHRASGALALHALEAMEAFQTSSDEGRRVKLETTVERPAMMPAGPADRRDRLEGRRTVMRKAMIVWGGWAGPRPRSLRLDYPRLARRRKASTCGSRPRHRRSPIPPSMTCR